MPDPKDDPKSGVRTFSPATNGIAAFAVTASCTPRWYANTLPMSTTRPCRRACTSTSTAQFGSERNSLDLARNRPRAPRGTEAVARLRSHARGGGLRLELAAQLGASTGADNCARGYRARSMPSTMAYPSGPLLWITLPHIVIIMRQRECQCSIAEDFGRPYSSLGARISRPSSAAQMIGRLSSECGAVLDAVLFARAHRHHALRPRFGEAQP